MKQHNNNIGVCVVEFCREDTQQAKRTSTSYTLLYGDIRGSSVARNIGNKIRAEDLGEAVISQWIIGVQLQGYERLLYNYQNHAIWFDNFKI